MSSTLSKLNELDLIKDIESIDCQSVFIAKPDSSKFDLFYSKLSEIVDIFLLKRCLRKK